MYGAIRTHLGKILHELAKQKEARILEGHLMSDHVHMCISIHTEVCGVERGGVGPACSTT